MSQSRRSFTHLFRLRLHRLRTILVLILVPRLLLPFALLLFTANLTSSESEPERVLEYVDTLIGVEIGRLDVGVG